MVTVTFKSCSMKSAWAAKNPSNLTEKQPFKSRVSYPRMKNHQLALKLLLTTGLSLVILMETSRTYCKKTQVLKFVLETDTLCIEVRRVLLLSNCVVTSWAYSENTLLPRISLKSMFQLSLTQNVKVVPHCSNSITMVKKPT